MKLHNTVSLCYDRKLTFCYYRRSDKYHRSCSVYCFKGTTRNTLWTMQKKKKSKITISFMWWMMVSTNLDFFFSPEMPVWSHRHNRTQCLHEINLDSNVQQRCLCTEQNSGLLGRLCQTEKKPQKTETVDLHFDILYFALGKYKKWKMPPVSIWCGCFVCKCSMAFQF